jgi:hypothetical protein
MTPQDNEVNKPSATPEPSTGSFRHRAHFSGIRGGDHFRDLALHRGAQGHLPGDWS